MKKLTFILPAIALVAAISTLGFSTTEPAFACYTPAQGCIEQGGPGQSFLARPEVAGCHFFESECVEQSVPPGMGAGP